MNYLYKTIVLAVCMLFVFIANAQFEDEKIISEAAAFEAKGKVSITNRHGNIDITSWEKDSIKVVATIRGESKSLERLNEALARTDVSLLFKNTYAEIITEFDQNTVGKSWNSIRDLAGENVISIDYKIYVPKTAKMLISNKFGDLFLENHDGHITIDMSHGNLRANNLPSLEVLRCSFANVYINSVRTLTATTKFSEVEINDAVKLILTSKSTTYEIEKVGDISISSSSDRLNITSLNGLTFTGSLSKLRLGTVNDQMTINMKYGSVRASRIMPTVCELDFFTSRTTVDLAFEDECNFKLVGNQSDGDFQALGSNAHFTKKMNKISGYYGSSPETNCTFILNGQKSKIFLR